MMLALLKYFVLHGSPEQVDRVAQFSKSVFGADSGNAYANELANIGITNYAKWLKALQMPTTMEELGIPAEDIPEAIVTRCMAARGSNIDGFIKLDKTAVSEIYMLAT